MIVCNSTDDELEDRERQRVEAMEKRLEQLEAEREAIERLIANAEVIKIPSTGAAYEPRMVLASDLENVLAGRAR